MWYLLANVFFTFQLLNVFWRVFLNQAILWNEFEITNTLKYFKATSSLKYFKIYQLNKCNGFIVFNQPRLPLGEFHLLSRQFFLQFRKADYTLFSFVFGHGLLISLRNDYILNICNHSRESLVEFESTYVNPHLRLGVT